MPNGGRSDVDFLSRVIEAVINAGASTINVPDTVGYNIPEAWGQLFKTLINRIPNSDKAVWSTHCHNDLGLAVANSLAAVTNGARQVECTINGLGERAGNAALEEVVMAIKTRADLFGVHTNIDTTHIVSASKLVSNITGFPVQPNKAIVGANAFSHASGIHQDGILKNRETYEIMRAEDVGWNANKLVLGKLSGRSAFKARLSDLGFSIDSEAELNEAFKRFKELADKKHEIFDEDLIAIISNESSPLTENYRLLSMSFRGETGESPHAAVVISDKGDEKRAEATGAGPVDAVFVALERIVKSGSTLELYSVNAVTEGTDAQGEVTVRLQKDGRVVNGNGADTDVIVASAKAYLDALNKMAAKQLQLNPQTGE